MSIDIEQRGGRVHHYNDTPNPALLNDEVINEVRDFLSYFAGVEASPLLIQHTYAYLKHHNNGRDVNPFKVGLWIKKNSPNQLIDVVIPDEVVKRGIYSDEKLRFAISELYSNLWKSNITTNLSDAYLAASIIEFEDYAYDDLEDLARVAYEHGHCMQTAWLILNNKTIPLDPKSQDVIDLCNNMHKHGELLSIPTNANPLVWGNSRLPQLANLADEEITNDAEDEILSSINSDMKELSIQGLYKHANSVQSEIEKRVRLAAEAEAEEERVGLAAEAEKMEEARIRLAAEVKKMDLAYGRQVSEECLESVIGKVEDRAAEAKAKEERLAVEAKEKKEKEERERLATEEKERERLAAEVKKKKEEERIRLAVEAKEAEERERLAAEAKAKEEARQTSKDSADPEFDMHDPFGDMEDDATISSENSAEDDAISISSAEYDDELDEAVVEVDADFESQLTYRFASAFNQLESIFATDFKPDEITHEIAKEYKRNCKTEGGCSCDENARKLSKVCIGHTGSLRKKKLVIGAGRTSPDNKRKASEGKQQSACFVVCLEMAGETDYFDKERIEVYPHILFGFGDDRYGPHNCLAFMELIKVVHLCDCDEIEVFIKSTLRVAVDDKDFLYYAGTVMALDPRKTVTFRCMENGLLTYKMLKEISQAKKVREDKLKVINLDIPHYNASTHLSIVKDENYKKNAEHDQLVESKAQQYNSEWRKNGLPSRVKDAEVVVVGQGSSSTANKWRMSLNEANEELKMLKPSQHAYLTASEDEGSAKVSRQARKYFVKPTVSEPRGKHNRPIAYLRTSHDELSSCDYIEYNGKKFPIDQLAWVYADMELRGYTGRLLIIVDNGSQKTSKCNKGMSHLLDLIQEPDFGAVFMTTPNRTFDDAVAFQMLLEAEQIYDGLKIHCSQDSGKDRMKGARKVTERKIRRQVVFDEYNTTRSRLDERFVSTLSVPRLQLHNRMKRAASKKLTLPFLIDISLIQTTQYGSVSPWITETLRLMNERKNGSISSDQQEYQQPPKKRLKIDESLLKHSGKKPAFSIHKSYQTEDVRERQQREQQKRKRSWQEYRAQHLDQLQQQLQQQSNDRMTQHLHQLQQQSTARSYMTQHLHQLQQAAAIEQLRQAYLQTLNQEEKQPTANEPRQAVVEPQVVQPVIVEHQAVQQAAAIEQLRQAYLQTLNQEEKRHNATSSTAHGTQHLHQLQQQSTARSYMTQHLHRLQQENTMLQLQATALETQSIQYRMANQMDRLSNSQLALQQIGLLLQHNIALQQQIYSSIT